MNKILLLLFVVVPALSFSTKPGQRIVYHYKNIPSNICKEDVLAQSSLIMAAWACKYVMYNFEESEQKDFLLLKAYNEDCSFFVRFNRKTHECEVEFNARDDSYDYTSFRNILDSFFCKDYFFPEFALEKE